MSEVWPLFESWCAEMSAKGLLDGDLPPDGCICFPTVTGVADTERLAG